MIVSESEGNKENDREKYFYLAYVLLYRSNFEDLFYCF